MKKPVDIYLILLIIASLASCTAPKALYVHTPDKVNLPGFKEAHEYKADISMQPIATSRGGIPFTYSFDLAFSPVNHLGIIASYRGNNNLDLTHSYGDAFSKGTIGDEKFHLGSSVTDIGIGWFDKEGERGIFECYAGYGLGSIANNPDGYNDPGNYYGRYHRLFMQLHYGVSIPNAIVFLGFKTIYKKFDAFGIGSGARIDSSVISELKSNYLFLMQPFVEIQGGNRFVRLSLQLGCQIYLHQYNSCKIPANEYDLNQGYIYNSPLLYFSLGLTFHHAPRFGKIGFQNKEDPKKSEYW